MAALRAPVTVTSMVALTGAARVTVTATAMAALVGAARVSGMVAVALAVAAIVMAASPTDNDTSDEAPNTPGFQDNPNDVDDYDLAQISVGQAFDLA